MPGAALPLLIVFVTGTDSLSTVATSEQVAVEVVRGPVRLGGPDRRPAPAAGRPRPAGRIPVPAGPDPRPVRLDLSHPEELDLLRHYGSFTTDTRVWAHGDPTPVIETVDSLGDMPRFTYRLDPAEVDQVRTALAEARLSSSSLVPRRLRTSKR
jgi:hypothetical protein